MIFNEKIDDKIIINKNLDYSINEKKTEDKKDSLKEDEQQNQNEQFNDKEDDKTDSLKEDKQQNQNEQFNDKEDDKKQDDEEDEKNISNNNKDDVLVNMLSEGEKKTRDLNQ